jgi:hypothetical protein
MRVLTVRLEGLSEWTITIVHHVDVMDIINDVIDDGELE